MKSSFKASLLMLPILIAVFATLYTLDKKFVKVAKKENIAKKLPSRDLMGQYYKLSEVMDVYNNWTEQEQQIYREQHSIPQEFIDHTQDYINKIKSL